MAVSRAEAAASRANRVLTGALLGVLVLGELAITFSLAPLLGVVMLGCTGGLVALVARDRRRDALLTERALSTASEGSLDAFYHDEQTRLPNRQHLIDQLARDIARSQRYRHDLTLVIVELARMEDLRAAWGVAAAERAVVHVADTLRRVTRNSDFLARLDDERFAVLLMQCNAEQARLFGERAVLAASNRPLKPGEGARVPVYVAIDYTALQYESERFRGPLDFLSEAGGDLVTPGERHRAAAPSRRSADARSLRQQLVRDYYPEGKVEDFAEAYRAYRQRTG